MKMEKMIGVMVDGGVCVGGGACDVRDDGRWRERCGRDGRQGCGRLILGGRSLHP